MINTVVYVPAKFKPYGKYKQVKVPTGETTKGLFGREKEATETQEEFVIKGYSDSQIDGEQLAHDIATAVDGLNEDGYEVINITPVTSGRYHHETKKDRTNGLDRNGPSWGWGWGYGYGFSVTEGVTIVARKIRAS